MSLPSPHTLSSIDSALKALGFQGPQQNPAGEGVHYWRKIQTPNVCLCNDSLQFLVTVYRMHLTGHGTPWETMCFGITGEYRPDTWAKLECYSVPWDRGVAELDLFQEELLRAWNAMYVGDLK
jgi:hypothetical protein